MFVCHAGRAHHAQAPEAADRRHLLTGPEGLVVLPQHRGAAKQSKTQHNPVNVGVSCLHPVPWYGSDTARRRWQWWSLFPCVCVRAGRGARSRQNELANAGPTMGRVRDSTVHTAGRAAGSPWVLLHHSRATCRGNPAPRRARARARAQQGGRAAADLASPLISLTLMLSGPSSRRTQNATCHYITTSVIWCRNPRRALCGTNC